MLAAGSAGAAKVVGAPDRLPGQESHAARGFGNKNLRIPGNRQVVLRHREGAALGFGSARGMGIKSVPWRFSRESFGSLFLKYLLKIWI